MNSVKEKFYKFRGEVLEAPVDITCINEKIKKKQVFETFQTEI